MGMITMNKDSNIIASKGKIVLVKGESQYNVLCLACDLIAKGFEENGYQTVVLQGFSISTLNNLYETIRNEMQDGGLFIFSFNALFHNMLLNENTSLYEFVGYPVFGFLVDHPCYHHTRLLNLAASNTYIGCFDMNHVDYVRRYYPKHKNVNFIPHFSFKAESFIPYENKSIDVYFPGSYRNTLTYNTDLEDMPKVFANIVKELITLQLMDKTLTLEEALRKHLASLNFKYTNEEFQELMDMAKLTDLYVRDYYREKIVRSILDAGIPLIVCGKGWEKLKEEYLELLAIVGDGGLDIEDNVKLISDSKIIINVFPSIKNGTHERIFTAMRNCSICFSNSNKYLNENFSDGDNIVLYDIDKIDEIPDKIKWILNEPDKAKIIAENGYHKAYKEYDEKHTARRVLDIMGME